MAITKHNFLSGGTILASDFNQLENDIERELNQKIDKNEIDDIYALRNAVYTKDESFSRTQVEDLLDAKANNESTYTKNEVNELLEIKANADNVYEKADIDNIVSSKANVIDVENANTDFEERISYLETKVTELLERVAMLEAIINVENGDSGDNGDTEDTEE